MEIHSDAELVSRCLQGDRSAFGLLAEKYKRHVYAIAYSRLLNWSDAHDVTQDVFLRAYVSLGQLRAPEQFRAWVSRIAYRCIQDQLRRLAKEKPMHLSDVLDASEQPPLAQEAFANQRDMEQIVRQGLGLLKEPLRTPLVMHYMEDIPHRQIAEALGISVSNVEVRIRRAREKLRDHFRRRGLEQTCQELLRTHATHHPLTPDFLAKLMERVRDLPPPTASSPPKPVGKFLPYVFAGGAILLNLFPGSDLGRGQDDALPSRNGQPIVVMLEADGIPVQLKVDIAGTLHTPRYGHRSVPLPDGRVLILKGTGVSNRQQMSSELFVPGGSALQLVAGSTQAHGDGFSAITLANGSKVLIAGGRTNAGYSAKAEIFDPATQCYAPVSDLNEPRADHSATLLEDGRVLIVGGAASGNRYAHATVEIFDPAEGTFRRLAAEMTSPRQQHTATLLRNGWVLIAGGVQGTGNGAAGPALQSAELFDPDSECFYPTGSLHAPRHLHTATLLADDRVLILGGSSSSKTGGVIHATAELYDPETGQFHLAGAMQQPREVHTTTHLEDGSLLIIGGRYLADGELHYVPEIERFDPFACSFCVVGAIRVPRYHHTTTFASDGSILVVGGLSESDEPIRRIERLRIIPSQI